MSFSQTSFSHLLDNSDDPLNHVVFVDLLCVRKG